MVELHPDNVVSRIRLAEAASQAGRTDEAIREFGQAGDQLKMEGRADEYVRVAERLLFHRPDNFAVARELAAAYIARKNPRLALAKLQGALKAAPRDPAERHAARRGDGRSSIRARRSRSGASWRRFTPRAHREEARDAAVRAALALDPTDGETRELAARWGLSLGAACGARSPAAAQVPSGTISSVVTSVQAVPPEFAAAGSTDVRSGMRSGMLPGMSRPGVSGVSGLTPMSDVARILSEADVFVKYGLAERAVDHLRRIFALEPEHREARERLAGVLVQIGTQARGRGRAGHAGRAAPCGRR